MLFRSMEKLNQQKTKGETQNKLLDDLETKKNEMKELVEKEQQISVIRQLVKQAVNAEKVLPAEDTMLQAENAWNKILGRIRDLDAERERLTGKLAELQARRAEMAERNAPLINNLQDQKSAIQGILHFYDDLERSTLEYNRKKALHDNAVTALDNARTKLSQKEKQQEELAKKLQNLVTAGESEVQNANRFLPRPAGRP